MKEFYQTFFDAGYLTIEALKEAASVGILSKDDYKEITGKAFRQPAAK